MAGLEKLVLRLDKDGDGVYEREYGIYPIETVDISSNKDAFSVAPPGLAASENILLGVSGMNADISISANVWNDGSDRAGGSHTSAVTTVQEQNTYLEDVMHDPSFTASWALDHTTGNAFNDDPVFLENIDITPISLSSPAWKPVTFRLRRGGSV